MISNSDYDTESTYQFDEKDLILVYVTPWVIAAICGVNEHLAVAKNKGARTIVFSALIYAAKQSQVNGNINLKESWQRTNDRS
jgi:hypothetical protein